MKLKKLTATRVSGGGGAPVVYSPLEYVPASVAQGLLGALIEITEHYVSMADSGDCGFWDAEKEDEVKHARAAIAAATEES